MKVLICGDREWSDEKSIRKRIEKIPKGSTIIHGAARGADSIAGNIAEELGFKVISVKADWKKYYRAAGPIRNRKMLDMKPDLVIAFHSNIEESKGTKDCVTEAKRRNIDVELIA